MKAKTILVATIILILFGGSMGCEEVPSDYYKGKILVLNNHIAFYDVIEVQQSVENGLAVGQTLSVGVQLTEKGYKLNDVVYFKIIRFQKSVGFETAEHLWASYSGIIELYHKS